jgi:hypothetical protein
MDHSCEGDRLHLSADGSVITLGREITNMSDITMLVILGAFVASAIAVFYRTMHLDRK